MIPFRQKKNLSAAQQDACIRVINELVLMTPWNLPINSETILVLSEMVQKEYIELYGIAQTKMQASVLRITENLSLNPEHTNQDIPSVEHKSFTITDYANSTDKQFIRYLDASLGIGVIGSYNPIGFTPKLARYVEDDSGPGSGLNCFGSTIFLGAACKMRGIPVELALTADHPTIITSLDGIRHAEHKKITGYTVQQNTDVCLYYPTQKDGLPFQIAFIVNFERGIIYEIFENLEVLHQLSLKKDIALLPGSEKSFAEVALIHADVLQGADWKEIQHILFPEISAAFDVHWQHWDHEKARMKEVRKYMDTKKIFKTIAAASQKTTSYVDKSFDSGQENIIRDAQKHSTELLDFLFSDQPLPTEVNHDVVLYFSSFKELLEKKEEKWILPYMKEIFENAFD